MAHKHRKHTNGMEATRPNSSLPNSQLVYRRPRKGLSLQDWALRLLLTGNLFLIPMSLFALSEVSGPLETLKLLIVGIVASSAAYAVSKFAITRLAPLAAIGFRLAGVLALVSILATGSGMFLGSLTAMIHGPAEVKTYQAHGDALTVFIEKANEASLITERITPSVQSVAGDIERTATCEAATSCLSERGTGGVGPMSLGLETRSARAFALLDALDAGALERVQLLDELNRLNRQYHEQLAAEDVPLTERRVRLQAIHAEVIQATSSLSEAMPVTLLESFVRDLRQGAALPGDPQGTRLLSTYLRDHGNTLADALASLPENVTAPPSFPNRPGMLDLLGFLADFAAIAAIIFVAELCLPITLYVMTWLRLVWELEKRSPQDDVAQEEDGFGGLIDLEEKPSSKTEPRTSQV